jgi:hypothetical protein
MNKLFIGRELRMFERMENIINWRSKQQRANKE